MKRLHVVCPACDGWGEDPRTTVAIIIPCAICHGAGRIVGEPTLPAANPTGAIGKCDWTG